MAEPYAHFVACLLTFIKKQKNKKTQIRVCFAARAQGQYEMHRLQSVASIYIWIYIFRKQKPNRDQRYFWILFCFMGNRQRRYS